MFWTPWIVAALFVSASCADREEDLLMSENGNGYRERRQQQLKEDKDDDKKTLSQQVIDGKYGLIQKELFRTPPKRPGIISYDTNNEVPKDNASTLGGLNKSDIWLAENHLLVLRGGIYPVEDNLNELTKPAWSAIDNFVAPRRQVKIPENPKVPPPFPVQLEDGGPVQILGTNSSGTIDVPRFPPPYPIPPPEGYVPGGGPFFPPPYPHPTNSSSGQPPYPIPPRAPHVPGNKPPFFPLNGSLPPFFDYLPPGAAILPPPNLTEPMDEDDLSIYYPPPYSFYYQQDNTTEVPPGPLVPGIILPPPPDFFAPLEKKNKTIATTQPVPQIHPTTTTTRRPPTRPTVKLPPSAPTRFYLPTNNTRLEPTNVTVLKQVKPTQTPNLVNLVNPTKVPIRTKTTQYYFYEESPTVRPKPQQYHVTTPYIQKKKPTITYKSTLRPVPVKVTTEQPEYYYVTNKPYVIQQAPSKPDSFRQHIERLQQEIQSYRTVPKYYPSQQPNFYPEEQVAPVPSPKPVYQYSFQVANYEEQHQKFVAPPRYTVEIQPAIEITTPATPTVTPAPTYQSTPAPVYYKKNYYNRPDYNYQVVTENPVYQLQYTQQDEKYLDDITRTYFTTFGQKIASTTPIYEQSTIKPVSLESDILVNYSPPLPNKNNQAEFIRHQQTLRYREEDKPREPAVQTVRAISIPLRPELKDLKEGSFISYELPGDNGAHFYFITPQLAGQRDQGVSYYYSKPFRRFADHRGR